MRQEAEKQDTLLDEWISLEETFNLATAQFKETDELNKKTKEEIEKITQIIKDKQVVADELLKKVEEERKINLFEEAKNQRYAKNNAALKAKLEFIETKYD